VTTSLADAGAHARDQPKPLRKSWAKKNKRGNGHERSKQENERRPTGAGKISKKDLREAEVRRRAG